MPAHEVYGLGNLFSVNLVIRQHVGFSCNIRYKNLTTTCERKPQGKHTVINQMNFSRCLLQDATPILFQIEHIARKPRET